MTRKQKAEAYLATVPRDIAYILDVHNRRKCPKSANNVRRLKKWVHRIEKIRRIMDKRYPEKAPR